MSDSNPPNADWSERDVFVRALALPLSERDAFLMASCPNDEARARIYSLLRYHEASNEDLLTFKVGAKVASSEAPTKIDEFLVIRKLGEGGMGEVYLAEDTILKRKVALKILASHLTGSERALARFRDEARNAASLKHPAIIPVFRFGQDGSTTYLVTEFVDGPPLSSVIAEQREKHKTMRTQALREWHRRAIGVALAIAEALDCAHRAGIIHRDVKPSNILLDPEHGPRLADFGIAKQITEAEQSHTNLIGTCHYMSPEQVATASNRIDQRSDIFSLGVVLYEMLALRRPFDGPTPPHVLRAIVEIAPPRLRSIDRRIQKDLETICHKSIEKLPRDRYPTAAHVAADLRCLLAGEPILAKPPTAIRILARKVHRYRVSIITFLVTGVFLGLVAWFWIADTQRRSQLCRVRIESLDAGLHLHVAKLDGSVLKPIVDLNGRVIPAEVLLPPGLYRIRAIARDGAFCETSTFLVLSSETTNIRMPSVQSETHLEGMVRIEGGSLAKWVPPENTHPAVSAQLDAFYIDSSEVSNAAYREFTEATGHPEPYHWQQLDYPIGLDERPVVGVSWEDANAYCRFVAKRLPSASEWEFAMRWPDGRLLPWTTDDIEQVPEPTVENIERMSVSNLATNRKEYEMHTHDVHSFPSLLTAAGLYHAATNVAEMTETVHAGVTSTVVVKGASWVNLPEFHDLTSVRTFPFESKDNLGKRRGSWSMQIGFRCACSAQP